MAKSKEIKFYKGRYLGSLTEAEADSLLSLQRVKSVPNLKNCIYNLNDSLVNEIKEYAYNYNSQMELFDDMVNFGELRDYQTVGTAYAYIAKKMLLGDSVGLGKTVQMAGMINLCRIDYEKKNKNFRYIFLTDKNSVMQIRDKLIKFTGEYVHVMTGEQKYVDALIEGTENEEIWFSIVGSHSLLDSTKFIKWLTNNKDKFNLLIFDESAKLKKTSSGVYKTTKIISKWFERFIMLNATPYEIKLDDFYNQLKLLDDALLPTIVDFEKEYCVKSYTGFYPKVVDYKNHELFMERISLRYFARTRKSLGAEYSNNNSEVIFSPLSKEQKYLMSRTTMWRMVCDCPLALDSSLSFDEITVPKLKDLRNLINKVIPQEKTVMIYCYYKEAQSDLAEFIENEGYSCEVINGDTSSTVRDRVIEDFNNNMFKVLITNVQRSIDLTNCNNLILYSFDYNPRKMVQIEGRITREFDIRDKSVYLLCSEGKEKNYLNRILKTRAAQGSKMTKTDFSAILDILATGLNKNNK